MYVINRSLLFVFKVRVGCCRIGNRVADCSPTLCFIGNPPWSRGDTGSPSVVVHFPCTSMYG